MKPAKQQISFIENCYKLYEQKMYRIAFGILHDEGLAEDALQDSFLKLMKHEVQFDSAESDDCKRYIITVTRNAAIDIYNKKQKESEIMYLTDNDERFESLVDEHVNTNDDWKTMMKSLPQIYYDVIYCLVIKDYSTKETAKMLNITESNVRKRYERAKLMMREKLVKTN